MEEVYGQEDYEARKKILTIHSRLKDGMSRRQRFSAYKTSLELQQIV